MRPAIKFTVSVAVWSLALVGLVGCATYSSRISAPRSQFERGDFDGAITTLKQLVDDNDNDQLLYLMDLGMVYHTAGRYEEAIKVFLRAEKLAEIKDYTSLSQEAMSVLLSDEVKPYKGELFENLLINVYLAIDYTMLGNWDDALVECRRVNHKIDRMIKEANLPYGHNAFAKYLAAVLFEARREYNDALVDYRMVGKWSGDFPYLGDPLLRLADRLKMSQEFEEFQKKFGSSKTFRMGKNEGEIVLLVEQGRSPVKVPSEQFALMPRFQRRDSSSDYVSLRTGAKKARTFPLYDIEQVAILELESRIALIAAKKVGGLVAKELVSRAIENETKSPLLGALLRVALFSQDKADLRSWTTLPARLQLARVVVPAGRHNVALDMVMRSGYEAVGVKLWENIEVKPGQKVFLNYRTPE